MTGTGQFEFGNFQSELYISSKEKNTDENIKNEAVFLIG